MSSTPLFIEFLNHGTLPFVGRRAERDRIVAFWRGAPESHGLRAFLVIGEAGSGKSRLLDETFPAVMAAGGAVVHVRLRPEGAVSIAPLLAQGLWRSEIGRQILRQPPDESLPAVIALLRRLCGLRRVLLVIEDIHLLEGATLREFALLVEALADEHLALLAAARPVEIAARGTLESRPTEEMRLGTLTGEEIGEMWSGIFGGVPEPAIVTALLDATRGNALALRSVLRGAINAGAIGPERDGGWRVQVSRGAFAELAGRNARQLTLGMTSHLGDEERRVAALLSALGEVFSREAAAKLIPDGEEALLDSLLFRGVLVRSTTAASSINGARSDGMLLAFTHSLLHKTFAESTDHDVDRLVRTVLSRAPLYSVLPFQIIAGSAGAFTGTQEEIGDAIQLAYEITRHLSPTPDWQLVREAWRAAERLTAIHAGRSDPAAVREYSIRLIHLEIYLINRGRNFDPLSIKTIKEAAGRLMELTEEPLPEHLRPGRLHALAYAYDIHVDETQKPSPEIWDRAEALLELDPSLIVTAGYLNFLSFTANVTELIRKEDHFGILRQVESRYEMLIAWPDAGPAVIHEARTKIGSHLLQLYESEEEVLRRKREAVALLEIAAPFDWLAQFRVIELHVHTLDIPFVDPIVDAAAEAMRKLGVMTTYFITRRVRMVLDGARGEPWREIAAAARALVETCVYSFKPSFTVGLTAELLTAALLRNEMEWVDAIMEEYEASIANPMFPFCELLLAAIVRDRLPWACGIVVRHHASPTDWLYRSGRNDDLVVRMALAATGGSDPDGAEAAIADALVVLRKPILNYYDILTARCLIGLVESIWKRYPDSISRESRETIGSCVEAIVLWLHERRIGAYMIPTLDLCGRYLPPEQLEIWRGLAKDLEGAWSVTNDEPELKGESRLTVTMLGAIQTIRPGEEPQRLRGARHQALLGLLVAQALLKKKLQRAEFLALASGEIDDPEKARQWTNKAVLRLREAIGNEAIVTGGETPGLNLELVTVDLIEAESLLVSAELALRERNLSRGREALLAMLAVTRGEVPYPGLYDRFFESAREEFESRSRRAIVEAARRLLAEEDHAGAEELLGAAFGWMKEDEEIAELLEETLRAAGKATEAVRVRMAGATA